VTLIEAGPCPVVQVKTPKRDGYAALQLGFDVTEKGKPNKPQAGHLKAAGIARPRFVREVRIEEEQMQEVGSSVDVEIFDAGEKVDITGVSKGRGFAGVLKRHHSHRGPETHGSMYHRRTGSIGASAWPSRVIKGKHMPGHLGAARSTVQNIVVVKADKERNLLIVRGAVPGANNSYVMIRKAVRQAKKKAVVNR
jgi:large subunit ribosomal protein L3